MQRPVEDINTQVDDLIDQLQIKARAIRTMVAGHSGGGMTEQYTFVEIECHDQLNRLGPRNLPDYFSGFLWLIAAESYIGLRDHSDQSPGLIDHGTRLT